MHIGWVELLIILVVVVIVMMIGFRAWRGP